MLLSRHNAHVLQICSKAGVRRLQAALISNSLYKIKAAAKHNPLNISSASSTFVRVYCQPAAQFLTRQICQRKLFFFFPDTSFRRVSSGSRGIKGLSRTKRNTKWRQQESLSPSDVLHEIFSDLSVCFLFDVRWGVLTRRVDTNQTAESWLTASDGTRAVISVSLWQIIKDVEHTLRSATLMTLPVDGTSTKLNRFI